MEKIAEGIQAVNVSTEDGDWEGWYINGKLVDQGHSVQVSSVLEALGADVSSIELSEEEIEKLGYSLPATKEKVDEIRS